MRTIIVVTVALAAALPAGAKQYSHQKYFEHYEGTKTCLACHEKEAKSFFHSQHYQWKGEAPAIVDSHGKELGKINTINDFCTNPVASWIGLTKNSRGEILSKGCSKCHAGHGLLPSATESPEQLENIDCLICHASGYQRDLYPRLQGGWVWKPILWRNQEGLDSVAKRIGLPTRTTCLRCHAGSGGGPNFKRGDLEYALTETDKDFDVHMGTDGADLQCVDCHAGSDHRLRGRGTDLSGSDMPAKPLACDNADCHGPAPHRAEVLNIHAKRVYCTTCHVPTFAKQDATDMVRDWSVPKYNEAADKWSATITMAKDVKPVYAWYDGTTWEQLPRVPVTVRADGTVGMMIPQGDRNDPAARIFPFKLHRGRMPVLDGKNWLVPIVVEAFFADGNIDKAVKNAATDMYGVADATYHWVDTVRYMGIFHEVEPASKALACLDCHAPGGRLDWKALGYDGDPLLKLMKSSH
jgi:Cytochrome c bacterial